MICPTHPHSILVVDDEPDHGANLRDVFADLGYRVDVSTSGPEAIRMCHQKRYAIALLDLRMPGADGIEVFREMQKLNPQTEGILITAYANPQTVEQATRAGFTHVFAKPIRVPDLLRVIGEALEHDG